MNPKSLYRAALLECLSYVCSDEAYAAMMTAAALIGMDSTPMEGFQKENVEKLLSEKGLINLDEYRVSVMAAFGYRAGEPKRAKTRQAVDDVVDWIE